MFRSRKIDYSVQSGLAAKTCRARGLAEAERRKRHKKGGLKTPIVLTAEDYSRSHPPVSMIDSNFHVESCVSAMGRSTTAQIRRGHA
jgi:hypothetical protein